MKTKIAAISLAAATLLFVTACQPKKTAESKTEPAKVEAAETGITKEELKSIATKVPKLTEITDLINTTGAAYLAGVTMEDLKTETLLTRTDKAKAMGFIAFDLVYTQTYRQVEANNKLVNLFETLTVEMGFQELEDYVKQVKKDYEGLKDKPNSQDSIMDVYGPKFRQLLYTGASARDLSLILASSVVKSLNVISYLTLFAPQKDQLLVVLKNQKGAVNAICEVLAKSPADEELAKYLKVLDPINKHFQSEAEFTTQTIDQINKITTVIIK